MSTSGRENTGSAIRRAAPDRIRDFAISALTAAGSDPEQANAVADALTETSLRGVDSHGIRLLVHYSRVVQTGRVNPKPKLSFDQTGVGTATVDGDDGFGHYASFFAIERGANLARESG